MLQMIQEQAIVVLEAQGLVLSWNLHLDHALVHLRSGPPEQPIWSGSLLPLLWITDSTGCQACVKAAVDPGQIRAQGNRVTMGLTLGVWGTGNLEVHKSPDGLNFHRLTIDWSADAPRVIGLYFGAAPLDEQTSRQVPRLDRPFWPNWQAEGFCVPSAKGAPVQSFFRCWDFGHTDIPLGNFGIAMGTPYAAAYPRPVLAAAMGSNLGWIALGAGCIPDGAMTLQVRASCGCIEYLYREDLWGGPDERQRTWNHPLRLALGQDAFAAFAHLYDTFDPFQPTAPHHLRSYWGTWGDFLEGHFELRSGADFAADKLGARVYGVDDYWETWVSSGMPDCQRFPQFDDDIQYIRDKGLEIGFWQATGWVTRPEEVGLSSEDLLCGVDGQPRYTTWNMNPRAPGRRQLMLDPSSPRARQFLINRMHRIMRQLKPTWLKLDFSYGLHGPDVTAPRNPAYRGERLGYELLKLCVDAARQIDPNVTIQYYSLHPLSKPMTDLISLDDLGDAFGDTAGGHGHWSIWAALAGRQKTGILSSSGYEWEADTEQLLNTAVIGVPGTVMAQKFRDGREIEPQWIVRRRAVNRWFRRTTHWQPLWLNTQRGGLGRAPAVNCWGRLEPVNGEWRLTALALRDTGRESLDRSELRNLDFSGRWALISQDERSIYDSAELAVVPFDAGWIQIPRDAQPSAVTVVTSHGEQPATFTWADGFVRIDAAPANDLLGFLIRS